ncbi:hypothetical protein EON65_32445 [archaeon]|nr:MAG: hypothetical protein EON65_32445 [archaeon]
MLPGVFIILTVGQLISQIFVEEFTLQFMNLPGCEFVIRLSLGAEYIGICNFSWLLFGLTSHFMCGKVRRVRQAMESGKTNLTIETTPQSPTEMNRPNYKSSNPSFNYADLNWFDYLKYFWSTGVTLGSLGLICYGISIEAYILPAPIPAAYITAIVLMVILFFLEGLMIAIVATQYWDPETWRDVYPRAYAMHKLVNRPDCVKRFIIGRQFFTVFTNFLLAQIFTFVNWKVTNMHPALFFLLFKSGLVGVFVILAFAQLLSQLMATEFPLRFMDMYGSYSITVMCLFFDSVGVGHCAWSLYYLTRSVFCGNQMEGGRASHDSKPTLIKVDSPEVMLKTTPSLATMA